jgi:hypothetical protein
VVGSCDRVSVDQRRMNVGATHLRWYTGSVSP